MSLHILNAIITPYYDKLAVHGIRLHDSKSEEIHLKKLDWPPIHGHRRPASGSNDANINDSLSMKWKNNELWSKTSSESSIEARRSTNDEINFFGWFYIQLDGDVAYAPEDEKHDFLIIVGENGSNNQIFHAIRFKKGSIVVMDSFLIHSLPIPIMDGNGIMNFKVFNRAVNAKSSFNLAQHVHVSLTNIEKRNFIPLKDGPIHEHPHEPILPWNFSMKKLTLEHVTHSNFAAYGLLISHMDYHKEQIEPSSWPYLKGSNKHSKVRLLEQEFRLTWEDDANEIVKKTIFEGLSTSFNGIAGKAGIEYYENTNDFVVNFLITHPDGSYYMHAKDAETKFAMIFALPDTHNGDPVEETLKVFLFQKGQALRLRSGVWHSLPILIQPQSSEFREVVCETNATIHINIPYECEVGLKFKNLI